MFEMFGNFLIGDYFCDEVIEWGFEFLISFEWFDFFKDKFYMIYYLDDKDLYNCWIVCGVELSYLVLIEDNFWEIGVGFLGLDIEIFFDCGEDFDLENIGFCFLVEDIENDCYIEIWNIVFL